MGRKQGRGILDFHVSALALEMKCLLISSSDFLFSLTMLPGAGRPLASGWMFNKSNKAFYLSGCLLPRAGWAGRHHLIHASYLYARWSGSVSAAVSLCVGRWEQRPRRPALGDLLTGVTHDA